MTRRKARRDGIADHVTRKLAWTEADRLLQETMEGGSSMYRVDELLEMAEQLRELGRTDDTLDELLTSLRRSELRNLFDTSFDEHDNAGVQKSCRDCGAPLQRAGSSGRYPRYCRSACRQRAYRRRKGHEIRRVRATADLAMVLMELERRLLRESAYMTVDNRDVPRFEG